VRPTGGGKSLVFNAVSGAIKGVTLCICPLLSLGADQSKKVLSKSGTNCKSVASFHLDELSANAIRALKLWLETPGNLASKSIMIFTSPQAFHNYFYSFLSFMINRDLVRLVVVDEIHLVSHFGSSIRKEFAGLKSKLFKAIKSPTPMLLLTTTCSTHIVSTLQLMFDIQFNAVHWPAAADMKHRSVKVMVQYTSRAFQYVSSTIKSQITPHPTLPNKVIIYSNCRVRIQNFSDKLETLLDKDPLLRCVDVLTLVGTFTKEEKAANIRLFLNGSVSDTSKTDVRVLCATSGVGNAGIDCPDVRSVYRIDFPPSLLDIIQEKGRAGRRPGASSNDYTYHICISLESLIFLFKRILNPQESIIDENYRYQQIEDLLMTCKVLMSPLCYAIAFESIIANPVSIQNQPLITPCYGCPACRSLKIFPRLHRGGCSEIIFDMFIQSTMVYTLDNVIKHIRKVPNVGYKLFMIRIKTINPLDIKKMLFIFITARILELES